MDPIHKVTPDEVKEIKEDNDTIIVDVRENEEVAQGMIEGARHIPLDKLPHSVNELEKDKHYVFVCRSGNRSMMAASFMDEHGFKVSNMEGGMKDWDGEVMA
ncbi:rhodanese-like domain-containing protein [Lentibacillus salicampi]|uniref:Rhodanese-like domain-containing protein n=1 Tax=Lentibacillus salicampi TaxID=175306 RepID=A0A4Y9ABY8_9BACI|nr:rhodanese-like domain-containing protein [Lentibacillus salicampi]TFJ92822.1 rhodanese-like domain-containing protein [Lentibacillus salicampi]